MTRRSTTDMNNTIVHSPVQRMHVLLNRYVNLQLCQGPTKLIAICLLLRALHRASVSLTV